MRFRLDALFKPVDPVVAAHASSRHADAAVAALRRAGYGSRMLSVVGQAASGAVLDVDSLEASHSPGAPHWAASGAGLGLLWALFTATVVVLHPSGAAAFVALIAMGVLTLALQAAVVAQVIAPAQALTHDREPGAPSASAPTDSPSWRFLVVVHGSRSDVALARAILAAR